MPPVASDIFLILSCLTPPPFLAPNPPFVFCPSSVSDYLEYNKSDSVASTSTEDEKVSVFANRTYEEQPNSGTDVTCFYTNYRQGTHDPECDNILLTYLHQTLVYYGVRFDCILSSPLILISFWFFWHDSFGGKMISVAFACAFTKFLCSSTVLTCILIDDPSFMREIFEKSYFGSYESKILYSYTMIVLSTFFNITLIVTIVMATLLPDISACKYRIGASEAAGDMNRFEFKSVLSNVKEIVAKSRNTSRISVVEAFPIGDLIVKEHPTAKSNPV
ncbi:hypothetical protein CRE_00536 [Caenorhabditis remanei]|uniref:Uncharacterized protein n=1 Tax=Caenorhabditis remanei TaxID=31234 RepID=E3LCW6_CAERE|nr:hypothetical protein CRE_00536 [Caenorhabditis remanei]